MSPWRAGLIGTLVATAACAPGPRRGSGTASAVGCYQFDGEYFSRRSRIELRDGGSIRVFGLDLDTVRAREFAERSSWRLAGPDSLRIVWSYQQPSGTWMGVAIRGDSLIGGETFYSDIPTGHYYRGDTLVLLFDPPVTPVRGWRISCPQPR